MTSSFLKKAVLPAVIVIASFVMSIAVSIRLGRDRPALPAGYEDSDLDVNGSRARGFALGMEGLIADWYWIRALQYIGDKVLASGRPINIDDLRDLNPRLLYPFLQNATDLDPHFLAPYSSARW